MDVCLGELMSQSRGRQHTKTRLTAFDSRPKNFRRSMWSNIMSRVSGRLAMSEKVDDLDSSDLAPSCPIPEMRSEPLYDEAEHEVDAAADSVENSADFSELGLGRLVPTEYTASPARARQPSVRTFAEGKTSAVQ